MRFKLVDTDRLPETDPIHGEGVCMIARGLPGEKYPDLQLLIHLDREALCLKYFGFTQEELKMMHEIAEDMWEALLAAGLKATGGELKCEA